MPDLATGPCSDVCVLGWDGDEPEFYDSKVRKAHKPHVCCECHETIEVGCHYEHVVGKWEGTVLCRNTCLLCVEIRTKFSCDGTWVFTTIWDSLTEGLFDRLTFGCLEGLSPAAREKVLEAWRKWKGLAV
jgi:hypothetical protein